MKSVRFAFPLFVLGSSMLAFGPLLVRLSDVGPVQSAFWRLTLGAPLLFVLAYAIDRTAPLFPARGGRLWLCVAAIFFAADLAVWHFGIGLTQLANATLLANSTAFMFPIWGYLTLRRWPSRTAAAALLLAGVGIALLVGRSASLAGENFLGDMLCLAAGVFYTGYFVAMDKARGRLSVLAALAPATAVGAIVLLPAALAMPGAFWPSDWTPLLLLALGSQVAGQGLVIYGLPHLTPLASGISLLIQPVISAMIGYIWFGEILALLDYLGMTVIFAALLLVRLPSAALPPVEKRVPPAGGGVMPPACRKD